MSEKAPQVIQFTDKQVIYAKQCSDLREALVNEIAALLEMNWPKIDRIRQKPDEGDEIVVALQIKISGSGILFGHVKLAYAEKYVDEGDVQVDNPKQPALPGVEG